ncbi:hypothetical protein cyc_06088 [Cyclospora cayetanensis]|uniref:THIF-type NAD/FAD binding fold domain-containing protein n=1 Tax=Cyclospora cayetanensis TaxID=88456 RepID=A0A1D3D2X2_9EIME|nr:hypothetical protein cyc_06088 [Cyclospora cayetanensis]
MNGQHEATQDAGASGCSHGSKGPLEEAQKVLDRQIRLWGLEAQRKLLAARVLILGLSAINAEASKDLALAGVSQTLCDDRPWGPEDIRTNYLPALAASLDTNCSTAEASKKGLASIASFVSFASVTLEALGLGENANPATLEGVLKQFTCICVAAEMFPLHTLVGHTCKLQIASVPLRALTVARDMGQLAAACRKLGVVRGEILSAKSYLPPNSTPAPKEGGDSTRVSHPPLLDALSAKLVCRALQFRTKDSFPFALLRWELEIQQPRRSLVSSDTKESAAAAAATEMEAATAAILAAERVKVTPEIRRALRDLATGYNVQLNATAAVVGGLVAQEVRKFVAREQKAVPNVVVFDGHSSCAAVASVPDSSIQNSEMA